MNSFYVIERPHDFEAAFARIKFNGLIIDPADAVESLSPTLDIRDYYDYVNKPFRCLLDRQIVSYLVDLVRGKTLSEKPESEVYRSAAALQAFLVLSGIDSEPSIAFAEYIDTNSLQMADKQLAEFRSADNLPVHLLLDIVTSRVNFVAKSYVKNFPQGDLQKAIAEQPGKIKAFEINPSVPLAINDAECSSGGFNNMQGGLNA